MREVDRQKYVFLTLPNYSIMAVTAAMDVLRMANRAMGRTCYEWTIASVTGSDVVSSNGLVLSPTRSLDEVDVADIVFVCGGERIQEVVGSEVVNALRRASLRHAAMGSLCTGAYALAEAGLLGGYKAAIHWEHIHSAQELFPQVVFTDRLFVVDRGRYTCAGGAAPVHLMLRLVRNKLGEKVAAMLAEQLNLERIRDDQEKQYVPMQTRVGHFQSSLIEIAELMEANIEEPLSLNDISELVGISRRQLERLFKRYVGVIPSKYYMDLRLQRARSLILQTTLPILKVALVCGFANGPYFSRCYKEKFDCRPSEERNRSSKPAISSSPSAPRKEPVVRADMFTQLNSTSLFYAHP